MKRIPPLAGYIVVEFFMGKVQSKHNLALVRATLHVGLSFVRFLVFAYFDTILHNIVLQKAGIVEKEQLLTDHKEAAEVRRHGSCEEQVEQQAEGQSAESIR